MKSQVVIFFFFLIFCGNLFSQNISIQKDSIDYYDMSLEQLMALKAHQLPSKLEELVNSLIVAASKRPLSTRESPGIVTLITEEEIQNSGARDLIDLLRLVPGIDFGMDVEGVVGIGTRGLWAHEGKILLLIDGQEMNDLLFATNQFGNHFPVDQIKKIEIIRGPGSAIYGGRAEYGVINIITKSAKDISGISLTGTYGQMEHTYGRKNINLSAGKAGKYFQFSLGAFVGSANRSDRYYTDIYGNSYDMAGSSKLNPTNLNIGTTYKNLSFRWITDVFRTTVRDGYDTIEPNHYPMNFKSNFSEIKYMAKIGKRKKLILTPRVNFTSQHPWETLIDTTSAIMNYSKTAQRYLANITASYDLTRKIGFIAGTEMYKDKAVDNLDSGLFANGKKHVAYFNQAYFIQTLVKTRFVNLILGGRIDIHNIYGSTFVPRLGITKKFNKCNLKLLYSNAFRAPSIENINLNQSIKPEFTQVLEFEAGYQFTRQSIITANIFNITTKDPIVYYYNDTLQTDAYYNYGGSGSKGAEIAYRIRDSWGYLTVNYSFYSVAGKKKISDYIVPVDKSMLLAFPSNKVNLNVFCKANKHIGLNTSISYICKRYGYTHIDKNNNPVVEKFKPVVLANFFIKLTPPIKNLSIGIGCYDIFASQFSFIQPYNGLHAPLPASSREFLLKLTYISGKVN